MPKHAFTHDKWIESQDIPIHRGFYIEDLRTVALGAWDLRQCDAAFLVLEGMRGIVEVRVQEVPPGGRIPPYKSPVDELVYVLSGQGTASVWAGEGGLWRTFEWSTRSLFLIPNNRWVQFNNMQGRAPVRMLHYNYLPLVMSGIPNAGFLFDNPYESESAVSEELYSAAREQLQEDVADGDGGRVTWFGNFFPDLGAWDKLIDRSKRGATSRSLYMRMPGTELRAHMSEFPVGTYKKAHRHGPARFIVIPSGEGFSIAWPEGEEQTIVPWHEGSCFVPPDRWFHQHFNVGLSPARYLALHPSDQFAASEKVEDRARDQIEYLDEEPWIRQMFEQELAKRGGVSRMPPEVYENRDYAWSVKA